MLSVSDATKAAYTSDGTTKSFKITFPNMNDISTGTTPRVFTNEYIVKDSIDIQEQLQSGDTLDFTGCISTTASFELKIVGTDSYVDQIVQISVTANNTEEIALFYGKVDEVERDSSLSLTQKFKCYDLMNEFSEKDATEWYQALTYPLTLKQFRDSFWKKFGKTENADDNQQTATLVNDNFTIEAKQLSDDSTMTAETVAKAICQINGCFGIFNREGKFRYVYLNTIEQGLCPSATLTPASNLKPEPLGSTGTSPYTYSKSLLKKDQFEYKPDLSKAIVGLIIYDDTAETTDSSGETADDKSAVAKVGSTGEDDNKFEIENNFLVYGMGQVQLMAENIFGAMKSVQFHGIDFKAKGLPFMEVGDAIQFTGNTDQFGSYILNRTLSGSASLEDSLTAECEDLTSDIVTIDEAITAERFCRRIGTDELYSQITQTNNNITLEVYRATQQESAIETRLELTEDSINIHAKTIEELAKEIKLNADDILLNANNIDLKADQVTLDASVVKINGTITGLANIVAQCAKVTELAAKIADITTLTVQDLNAQRTTCQSLYSQQEIVANGRILSTTAIGMGSSSGQSVETPYFTKNVVDMHPSGNVLMGGVNDRWEPSNSLTLNAPTVYLKGNACHWETITIDGTSYTVLASGAS